MNTEVDTTPYTVAEVAGLTGLSRQTVIRLFERERGVLIVEEKKKGKRQYRSLRIPRPVFRRVVSKWTVQ
jgi:hypothetical protein